MTFRTVHAPTFILLKKSPSQRARQFFLSFSVSSPAATLRPALVKPTNAPPTRLKVWREKPTSAGRAVLTSLQN